MPGRSTLAFLLFACLVGLSPLAHASPPDPTEIEGFFDDLDFDDVVVSLSWAAWAVELDALAGLTPPPVSIRLVQPSQQPLCLPSVLPTSLGRAPPLA